MLTTEKFMHFNLVDSSHSWINVNNRKVHAFMRSNDEMHIYSDVIVQPRRSMFMKEFVRTSVSARFREVTEFDAATDRESPRDGPDE